MYVNPETCSSNLHLFKATSFFLTKAEVFLQRAWG